MDYIVKIWDLSTGNTLKKEILYSSEDDVKAMQQASAATPDGCRSTYEEINKEEYGKKKAEEKKEAEAWKDLQG
jgi:hypothetical protein